MIDYKNISLSDIMPSNLTADRNISASAKAIDKQLHIIANNAKLVLLIYRLDELNDDMLDALAWQYHVDAYDSSYSVAVKRNLIRKSIALHKVKGTPYAVKQAIRGVFEDAIVRENWEYGGEPYHFMVGGISTPLTSDFDVNSIYRVVKAVKNTRSWLDSVIFHRDIPSRIYVGGYTVTQKKIGLYPSAFSMPGVVFAGALSSVNWVHREVSINNG